jgi:biotin carboxyl carrier protein
MKQKYNYCLDGQKYTGTAISEAEGELVLETGESRFVFQVNELTDGQFVLQDEQGIEHPVSVSVAGSTRWVTVDGRTHCLEKMGRRGSVGKDDAGSGGMSSPMPGKVILVHVKAGDSVEAGDSLMVVEAMKMEHAITAKEDGTVAQVHFAEGDRVQAGATLLSMEASGEEG